MIRYIVRKLVYGLLVLFGVVTIVFFLFYAQPGDPARMLGGQHASDDAIAAIRKDLGLDLPLHKQYLLYLNDVSPFSIHNATDKNAHTYLDPKKYTYTTLFSVGGEKKLVVKYPYLRRSYRSKQKVADIIRSTFPETLVLAISAILIAAVLGILLGVLAAMNKDSFFDNAALVCAVLGMSGPSYFIGLVLMWVFAYLCAEVTYIPIIIVLCMLLGGIYAAVFNKRMRPSLRAGFSYRAVAGWLFKGFAIGFGFWVIGLSINGLLGKTIIPFVHTFWELPGTNLSVTGSLFPIDDFSGEEVLNLKNLILPAITLGIRPLAIVLQLTRSSMLDVMSQDYVRTARAKGLSNFKVIVKHALKNALNPVVTAISGWFASLLAGAVLVERVFAWKGLGDEVVTALEFQDMPVVMGAVLFVAIIFVILNIVVDVIYGMLDPRVRHQ